MKAADWTFRVQNFALFGSHLQQESPQASLEKAIFAGRSAYGKVDLPRTRCGPSAYAFKTFRVFPPDLPRTPYIEARETSV
jgi:hypothetical protein